MSLTRIDKLNQRLTTLKKDFEDWRTHFVEIQQYIVPLHGVDLDGSDTHSERGKKKDGLIINSAATLAAERMAAGMQSGLASQARPWMEWTLNDRDLTQWGPVADWLAKARDITLKAFAASNFYGSTYNVHLEQGTFGTGCMWMEQDFDLGLSNRPFTMGEYYLGAGKNGKPNALFRVYKMSVSQMVTEFGKENCSQKVNDDWTSNRYDALHEVVMACMPRDQYNPYMLNAENLPWGIFYYETANNAKDTFLHEGGALTQPFMAPRWQTNSINTYGYSPAMRGGLADCKMLQTLEHKKFVALDKQIDPPMYAPAELQQNGGLSVIPGDVTYHDMMNGGAGIGALYQVNTNLQAVQASIDITTNQIAEEFYNDLFLAISAIEREMTAFEVSQRVSEKMQMVGQVVNRSNLELYDVAIDRAFQLLLSFGAFPPPPEELEGQDIRIKYTSQLAQAQRMTEISSIESTAQFVGSLAGLYPEAGDKFNPDKAIDRFGDVMGTDPDIIRSEEEVREIRDARAQQQAQMQQQEAVSNGVADAKLLSETDTGGENALTTLLGGPIA